MFVDSSRRSLRPLSENLTAGSFLSRWRRSWTSGGASLRSPADGSRAGCGASPTGSTHRPAVLPRLSGSGFSPLSKRARTSRAVLTETPALRAISRNDASGFIDRNSAARRRPLTGLMGRVFPSRPRRASNWESSSVVHLRNVATVLCDTPVSSPIERSERWGFNTRMRRAAVFRSDRVSGRPCVTFRCTASANASASLPSKNFADIDLSPRSWVARSLCTPSITRIEVR